MSIIPSFGGRFSALAFAYGITPAVSSLSVATGNPATGASTIQAYTGGTDTEGGKPLIPVSTNTPITIGIGANAETVIPTAVAYNTLSGPGPGTSSITISATFANLHGPNEPITSGTFGLQDAINAINAAGGGVVMVDGAWYAAGGTVAILQAAAVPTSGIVSIEDVSTLPTTTWVNSPNSVTVVAAPSAATALTIASLAGVTGTWSASTYHVLFTYVTADGGESLASADYSFTATVSLAIGGTGPAASTGAVGYRVYIGTNATSACYLVPAIAANGTVIQCGPIAAFKLGTSVSIAAVTVASALIPAQSTSFPCGVQPIAASNMAQKFATVQGPFAVTGSVTSGSEWGKVQLPVGFLNQVGRTLRISLFGSWTPAGTAKLTIAAAIDSVYTGTTTTIFTATSAASSGAAIANVEASIVLCTASTGAAGTVECHGHLIASTATATPSIGAALVDSVQAVSSAADLTKQDCLVITISSDATVTTSQLRRMIIEVMQ